MTAFGCYFWASEIDEPTIVQWGLDNQKLFTRDAETGAHTALNVYRHMMIMISKVYKSAPDVRTMTIDEIEFFYDGIRADLVEMTKKE